MIPEKMLSNLVLTYIYDIMCINEGTDEDLEDYCNYEADGNEERKRLIREAGKACIVFKGMCLLAKKPLPPVQEVAFDLKYFDDKIHPKVNILHVPPNKTVTGTSGSTVILDDAP